MTVNNTTATRAFHTADTKSPSYVDFYVRFLLQHNRCHKFHTSQQCRLLLRGFWGSGVQPWLCWVLCPGAHQAAGRVPTRLCSHRRLSWQTSASMFVQVVGSCRTHGDTLLCGQQERGSVAWSLCLQGGLLSSLKGPTRMLSPSMNSKSSD